MLRSIIFVAGLVGFTLLFAGCENEGRGFSLPSGDIEKGRLTFEKLACAGCHSFRGDTPSDPAMERSVHVVLGGSTTRIRTYGDLVTSVINPSHRIAYARTGNATDDDGASNMKNYNETMTVQELVDIVTYLQTTYTVIAPQTHYAIYH